MFAPHTNKSKDDAQSLLRRRHFEAETWPWSGSCGLGSSSIRSWRRSFATIGPCHGAKLVSELLQEAVSQGDVKADIDVETAVDPSYASLYCRLQIGPGAVSEAHVEKLFEQEIEGLREEVTSTKGAAQEFCQLRCVLIDPYHKCLVLLRSVDPQPYDSPTAIPGRGPAGT
jgi:hypothetical protein